MKVRLLDADERLLLSVPIPRASEALGISERMVREYVDTGALVARHFGNRTVILVSSLLTFIRTNHPSPKRKRAGQQ
jgi:hypothetical protein